MSFFIFIQSLFVTDHKTNTP